MRKSILLLILLFIPFATAISFDDKSTLDTTVTIKNTFTLTPTSNQYSVKFVNASLLSYPRNDIRQIATNFRTTPKADSFNFIYSNPKVGSYSLTLQASVTTANMLDEIRSPVIFPLNNLDEELYPYLQPTQIIDVTPEIKDLASELIGDKTDLYEIEYTFGEYVRKNIAYDLGTLTANADQKSSWVLANKIGVCDEISNLFISLNRAAGIPTRYVSGVAYTNLDEVYGKNWVAHSWAEVYYPGYGWIPYDVTYGQYGFVDAGHIKLSESQDSSSSNVDYNYLASNVKLHPDTIDIDVAIAGYGDDVHSNYNFTAQTFKRNIGFGSYDLITVNIDNSKAYYQVADLYLAQTQHVEIIEQSKETLFNKTIHRKQVLLKPHSSEVVYWIVRVDSNLDSDYSYTLPITVYNTYNETSTTFINSRENYEMFDSDYFKNYQDTEKPKAYSKNIDLQCTGDKDVMYLEDKLEINCILDNKGDVTFNEVNICIDNSCAKKDLALQKIQLSYTKVFNAVGLKNIQIKASNQDFTKTSYVTVNVLDKPILTIDDLHFSESVDYGDMFEISFSARKNSSSNPRNVTITLISETNSAEWKFTEFNEEKNFVLKTTGDSLKPKDNHFTISIEYFDEKGNVYHTDEEFVIHANATFFENVLLLFNYLGSSVSRIF